MLYSYYTVHPDQLPAAVAAKEPQVFSYFVMTRLPAGVVGLILAAMLAAAMSTLSTCVNSMAMVSIHDLYHHLRPGSTDRQRLRLAQGAALFWGLLGTLAGLAMIRVEKALDFSYLVASILGGGLFGLFLLAFFDRKAHARGIYVGLAAGVIVTAGGTLVHLIALARAEPAAQGARIFPLDPLMLVTLADGAALGVGFLASRILADRSGRNSAGWTVWDLRRTPAASE
jgi:SSS family solute:Na+ symporter